MFSLGCWFWSKFGPESSSESGSHGRGYILSDTPKVNLEGSILRSTSPIIPNSNCEAEREPDMICSRFDKDNNIYPRGAGSLLDGILKLDGKAYESPCAIFGDEDKPYGYGIYDKARGEAIEESQFDGQVVGQAGRLHRPLEADIVKPNGLGTAKKKHGESIKSAVGAIDKGLCLGHPVEICNFATGAIHTFDKVAAHKKDTVIHIGMMNQPDAPNEDITPASSVAGDENPSDEYEEQQQVVVEPSEPSVLNSQEQAQRIVQKAKDAFSKLQGEVRVANDMLEKLSKKYHIISNSTMVQVQNSLVRGPEWLMTMLAVKNEALERLYEDLDEQQKAYHAIADERDTLAIQLEQEKAKNVGLDSLVLDQLETLGISDIDDLINRYTLLQAQVQSKKDHQQRIVRGESQSYLNHPTERHRDRSGIEYQPYLNHPNQRHLDRSWEIMQKQGGSSSDKIIGGYGSNVAKAVALPMPKEFKGKTRVELDRWYRYFDAAVESLNYTDKQKATVIGQYVPKLQVTHDRLMKKQASYDEIKRELLNALGSDSSVRTFTSRAALDRISKPKSKSYKDMFEELEQKVEEAYNEDNDQEVAELKKILIRLVQEDENTMFSAAVIPHLSEGYYRLKELIIGIEDSIAMQKVSSKNFAGSDNRRNQSTSNRVNSFPRPYSNERRPYNPAYAQKPNASVDREKQAFPPNSYNRRVVTCYRCQKPGHYSFECSNEQDVKQVKAIEELEMMGVRPVSEINTVEPDNVLMFGRKAMLEVLMDSVKVNAMLDSGACASVISESAIGKILRERKKGDRCIVEENPSTFLDKRLVGADGGFLNVVNCVRMPIAWGTCPPKIAKFFVVSGLQQDVLIGTNVLQDDERWMEGLKLALQGTKTVENPPKESQAFSFVNNVGWGVTATWRRAIPPNTSAMVKVNTTINGNTLIEAQKPGVESGLYRTRKGHAWVEYRNYTHEMVIIEKGETLAEAWPAEVIDKVPPDDVESVERVNVITDPVERLKQLHSVLNLEAPAFSAEGKKKLVALIEKYHEAFAATEDEFGLTSAMEHSIDTGDARPIKQPARPVPLPMKREVQELVETLVKQRAVEESTSEWNSPLVLVRKKDGSVRLCIDYRKLNAVTRKDAYPLPNQDAMLMNLKSKKFFTSLDLLSGFFQVPIAEEDKHKTAFSVLGKLWQFRVIPQGLTTSPAAFSRMMEKVFGDMNDDVLQKFIDDILIATETEDQHLEALEEVFKRVIKNNLKLKPKKCEIARNELVYLGHVVSEKGIEIGKDKIDKVQNYPVPSSVSQIRSFIGLASYHRKFIEGFAKIASPLIALTRKNAKFNWGDDEQKAFETLKEKLSSAPVLKQPDFKSAIDGSKPFVIWTDASIAGVGAVLTQEDESKQFHPLFYVSKACSDAERNYSITQLEALAVVVALRKLKTFILGAKIIVRTDHQPLVGLLKNGNLSPQLIRWALELQSFRDLRIEYVQGKANVVADALSRCFAEGEVGEHLDIMDSVVMSVANDENRPLIWFELLKADPTFAEICEKAEIQDCVKIKRDVFLVHNGFLLKLLPNGRKVKVVPVELRKALWEEKHSGSLGGHFGTKKLKMLLKDQYYWPNMGNDVANWTKICMPCFAHKSHKRDRPPLQPIKTDLPMQIVGMDLAEMPISEKGYKYILVIIDSFTKFAAAWPLYTKSAEEVARKFLENWCLREQRFPHHIISDMGREFDNKIMERITQLTGIEAIFSLGYNSQFNGLSERFIQTLKKTLAKRINSALEWSDALPFALFAYNSVPHEATGETPHFLLHGTDPFIPSEIDPKDTPTKYHVDLDEYKHQVLENLFATQLCVRETLERYRLKMQEEYNNRNRTHKTLIEKGDLIFVELPTERAKNALSKLASRWEGPARVIEVGNTHVKVRFLHGEALKEVHLSQVVKWQGNECEAQQLKGDTSRRTRTRKAINDINFSDSKALSGMFSCDDDDCTLNVGLVLPHSQFAQQTAVSINVLAEKVAVASCSTMTSEAKIAAFKKIDEFITRRDIHAITPEITESCWKATLKKCPHQAKKVKEILGKPLGTFEIEDVDVILKMTALQNCIHFMPLMKNMDTVIVGHRNAERLKNAIGANFYALQNPEDSETRSRVVFSSKAKNIIYIPTESLIYGPGSVFESATQIIMNTFQNLKSCNHIDRVFMLPILRHLNHPKTSQKFLAWYKEAAEKDADIIGMKELDEMKLIHWLNATPQNVLAIEYVDENGLLTEAGTQQLVAYLNGLELEFELKHRKIIQSELISKSPRDHYQSNENVKPRESGSTVRRGHQFRSSTVRRAHQFRGHQFRGIVRDRGQKRKSRDPTEDDLVNRHRQQKEYQ